MNATLSKRLNQVQEEITSNAFLTSRGIGNEIACYIFDYPARDELQVREHLDVMIKSISKQNPQLKVLHLNLLDVVVEYLKERGLFDKSLELEERFGSAAVLKALRGPLAAEKIRDFIGKEYQPSESNLFLLSGVGSVWPMLRAHSLLNCLHTIMGTTPLVMFYPGEFDGTSLRLFGRIESVTRPQGTKPYYRAFRLVPEGASQ